MQSNLLKQSFDAGDNENLSGIGDYSKNICKNTVFSFLNYVVSVCNAQRIDIPYCIYANCAIRCKAIA